MFRNFFILTFRNIMRHKAFSFINIAGLALGFTACILIGLFVWDEYRYDIFLKDGQQVYRVYDEYSNTEGKQLMAVSPPMFATVLKQDYPGVLQTARVMMTAEYKTLFETDAHKFYEQSGYFVDSTFFDVLPLPFKFGSAAHALDDPSSIVLSAEMATRFFGQQNPVGRQILKDKIPYVVKGVFDKNPKFHLQFNFLIPLASMQLPPERMQSWGWHQFFTYAKLKSGADVHALEQRFQNDVKQKARASSDEVASTDRPFFQPLKDIHLYSADFKFDVAQRGNITYVRALIIIAIFILLIACFNFVNLATAKSIQRAKEVGVRKSAGAGRNQLILQFVGETVLLGFVSLFVSVCLALLLLPWLNRFTGKDIPAALFGEPVVWLLLTGLTCITGIAAGFYPAFILSGFKPARVLKTNIPAGEGAGKAQWLRHGLVVAQFALSVLLIISAVVVFDQVSYLHKKNLGFNKEQIMFFPMRGDNMFKNIEAFKGKLLESPGVSAVSIGYGFPGDAVAGDNIIVNRDGRQISQSATQIVVDYDYVKTLGLQVIAGRDFSREMKTDKDHAWIINETAVKQLGFGTPQQALGQDLYWHPWGASKPDSLKTGKVIGVVKDFNYKSLYDKVETAVIQIFPDAAWKVAVKMATSEPRSTIEAIKTAWNTFTPEYPIEYKFLDENFEQMYRSEDKLRSLLLIFTAIAIFIGCLGLFGLAAYTAERRKKEVGIRKVLGASVQGIILLLSKDFMGLIVIALLIASPVAWYVMNKWLQDFAYRINIGWWVFAIAAALAITIGFITVSVQAIKAALVNPVKSLRME